MAVGIAETPNRHPLFLTRVHTQHSPLKEI
jgi:hypothetical protein